MSDIALDFGDAVSRIAQDLANMSRRLGDGTADHSAHVAGRGLALHHLAAGDMAEALKIMDAARPAARPSRIPATNQPRSAAKETR